MGHHNLIFFLLLILSLPACRTGQKNASTVNTTNDPAIVFAGYRIFREYNGIRAEQHWMKLVSGPVKAIERPLMGSPVFKVVVADRGKKELNSVLLEDVLEQHVEYVNDSGAFERRSLLLDSADLVVRMPVPEGGKYIRLFHQGKNSTYSLVREDELRDKKQ